MPPYILSVHAGHNAGACVGDASGALYAIQEERLCGEKNYWGFPKHSIKACLNYVGASVSDVAGMSAGGNIVLCRYHNRDDVIESYRRQETLIGQVRQRVAVPLLTSLRPNYGQGTLRQLLDKEGLADLEMVHYDHHTAHAATAYYGLRTSPDKKYLVVTCDGAGDGLCATVRVMGRGEDQVIATTPANDSLGAIYSWVTYGMGFIPMEHEYKLMGMAPYASESGTQELARIFHSYLGLSDDGLSFKRRTLRRMNDAYSVMEADLRGKRFDWICAGLQRFTEELLSKWVQNAIKATGIRDVLASGGVFMNVKANKCIADLEEVESFEAFPSCGDETLTLGAMYLDAARRFDGDQLEPLKHFYLGDDLGEEEIVSALSTSGLSYEKPDDISQAVADVLVAGHPLARCAGRMELGARALGNRSILGDPSNQDLVRIINQMVKKRDFWMPFAPMVLEERQEEYLHNPKRLRSPYMMMTFDTRENFRDLIAAVHNADLTCRAQLLSKPYNPAMYDILKAFEQKTGRGVILNTSFNLHGFPIVRTPEEAISVVKNSGLEYLQLGNYLVRKTPTAVPAGEAAS